MSELVECLDGLTAENILKRALKTANGTPFYLQVSGLNTPPAILQDGNTVAWYIADEVDTITYGVGNLVAQWDDFLGSGRDLIQAVGADQPLWSANGILFDGVSEYMKTVAFGAGILIQPEQIYLVLKQITWTNNDRLCDGNTSNTGAVFQNTGTPDLSALAGIASPRNSNLPLDTFGIIRMLINGANATFQINETAQDVGNWGATSMNGFTLGCNGAANLFFTNMEVKEVILRQIDDTDANEQDIYDYLATKYSI